MRLLLLLDSPRTSGTTKISVFCPYLPYSRQDKSHITSEAITINTHCHLLASVGYECLYTLDRHFMKGCSEDVVARIDGDEIAVLLPGADEASVQNARQRLQEAITGYSNVKGNTVALSVSIGCATSEREEILNQVFNRADKHMYQEKKKK